MSEILVIEDDLILRQAIARLLERNRYQVFEAGNGLEGLKLMRQQTVRLVITDLLMPEMEGIEAIRHLRRYFPDTKIIAISGGGRGDAHGYLRIASELGAHKTLAKPFSAAELLIAVEAMLPQEAARPAEL